MTAALRAVISDPSKTPADVLQALLACFGVEWLSWPYTVLEATVRREVADDSAAVPEWALHRAAASGAVALHDGFWEEWEHFHFLVPALCGEVADFRTHRELGVGQMMRAVASATAIRHELGDLAHTPVFSEEVARYVAAQALAAGVWYLPPPLDFAQRYAAGLRYRCLDCGNDAEVVFDDGLCDACVHRYSVTSLRDWAPDPQAVADGYGKRVQVYEKNPTAEVRARLADLLAHPGKTLQENKTDVCVARLLAALQYARYPLGGGAA